MNSAFALVMQLVSKMVVSVCPHSSARLHTHTHTHTHTQTVVRTLHQREAASNDEETPKIVYEIKLLRQFEIFTQGV